MGSASLRDAKARTRTKMPCCDCNCKDDLAEAVKGTVVVYCKAAFNPQSCSMNPESFESFGKVVVVDLEECEDFDDVIGAVEPPSALLYVDGVRKAELVGPGECCSEDAVKAKFTEATATACNKGG